MLCFSFYNYLSQSATSIASQIWKEFFLQFGKSGHLGNLEWRTVQICGSENTSGFPAFVWIYWQDLKCPPTYLPARKTRENRISIFSLWQAELRKRESPFHKAREMGGIIEHFHIRKSVVEGFWREILMSFSRIKKP